LAKHRMTKQKYGWRIRMRYLRYRIEHKAISLLRAYITRGSR
jgi:hypothetical protein